MKIRWRLALGDTIGVERVGTTLAPASWLSFVGPVLRYAMPRIDTLSLDVCGLIA